MNQMSEFNYASLTREQQDILKKAEDEINGKTEQPVYVMAFKADRQ